MGPAVDEPDQVKFMESLGLLIQQSLDETKQVVGLLAKGRDADHDLLVLLGAKFDTMLSMLQDHERRLRDLEEKGDWNKRFAELQAKAEHIDHKVDSLNRWRWQIIGAAIVIGPICGLILQRLFGAK